MYTHGAVWPSAMFQRNTGTGRIAALERLGQGNSLLDIRASVLEAHVEALLAAPGGSDGRERISAHLFDERAVAAVAGIIVHILNVHAALSAHKKGERDAGQSHVLVEVAAHLDHPDRVQVALGACTGQVAAQFHRGVEAAGTAWGGGVAQNRI